MMKMNRYNNYHKHTYYSNLRTLDTVTSPESYMKRAVELGHTTYFTTEHGFQGNVYEAQTLCEKYGLKPIYGVEAYYVDDISDKTDRKSYHIVFKLILLAKYGHPCPLFRNGVPKLLSFPYYYSKYNKKNNGRPFDRPFPPCGGTTNKYKE